MIQTKGYEQLLYEIAHWQRFLIHPHLMSNPVKGVIKLQITKLEEEVQRRTQSILSAPNTPVSSPATPLSNEPSKRKKYRTPISSKSGKKNG